MGINAAPSRRVYCRQWLLLRVASADAPNHSYAIVGDLEYCPADFLTPAVRTVSAPRFRYNMLNSGYHEKNFLSSVFLRNCQAAIKMSHILPQLKCHLDTMRHCYPTGYFLMFLAPGRGENYSSTVYKDCHPA
jgi:hypothetical protein